LAAGAAHWSLRRAASQSPLRCRPTAIAARGISTTKIDFAVALGIAVPGGLTSGSALPI